MYKTTLEAIQAAINAKEKHGYETQAVIKETYVGEGRFSIGFHFEDGLTVDEVYLDASGNDFKVLAIIK